MASYNTQPDNPNLLTGNRFNLILEKIPKCTYNCQAVNLPGLSMGSSVQPTPFLNVKVPGTNIEYEDLTLSFIVDEDMKNWIEMWRWMVALGTPENYGQYDSAETSTAKILIYTNKFNVNLAVNLYGVFPTSLGEIPFATTDSDSRVIQVAATFGYSYFDIEENIS